MFGYTPLVRPTLTLEEPPRELWDAMTAKLETTHNKTQLLRMAETFIPWLSPYGEILRARPGETPKKANETIDMMKTSTMKCDIARGIALIVASHQNLQAYVDSLSDNLRLLWRKVLTKNYVSQESAKKYLKVSGSLFNEDRRSYYYSGTTTWNKRELGWFQTATHLSERQSKYSYYHESEPFITVSATVRGIFFPYFFPELDERDIALAELPAETQWRTIELEKDSQANFKLLNSLIQQGELPLKKKGLGVTDMKRALKKLTLEEFFPNANNEYRQNLRAYYYMQVLAINEHKKNSKISIFKQFIADKLPPLWEQFFQQLLQHIHPLMEDKTSYKRYTLSPDNREFIQLITTDPVLRQLVIRAEGYRLMVKTEDVRKFETQLKKHGYLL